ncbi:MAG TPA: cytochrome c3 family protein [Pirellulales bacterium]|nr:cytochrome c3 family protein [Pirellulales bacterium]
MPQVFPRAVNGIARVTIIGGILLAIGTLWTALLFTRSSYGTDAGVVRVQPVPFSHEHHVGVLAIDCRYCHTSVEHAAFAGFPETKTCMNCHSQMWVGSSMLEPVRASFRDKKSLHWNRVHNLPGFVYFDHSIHVHKGVGCSTCHGRIDEMPFTYQVPSLLMEWCLDCHRHPERHLRPREEVFNIAYQAPADQQSLGQRLVEQYDVDDPTTITSCTICHR